jgi:hypothetical protein
MIDQPVNEPLDIERSPDFVLSFADNTVVADLGKEIEVSFLQISSKLKSVKAISDEDTITYEYEKFVFVSEIGKMRMNPAIALSMAVNIIRAVNDKGALNLDLLVTQLNAWKNETQNDPNSEAK